MIRCTVGVMAHNEEKNITRILHALLQQNTQSCDVLEIVVIASGCTDNTVALARQVAHQHPQIQVIVQAERAGKAAAINHLIDRARGDVIVLAGADTLPDPDALEHLTRPFADATVGMTGARVVPLNDPRTFLGFTIQMLWHVHHRMALRWPKLGELVAFRNVIEAIPTDSATDEVALEALISARGYRLVYSPAALVYNRGPQTIADFLAQRRRIFAGHLHIAATYQYVTASMQWRVLTHLIRDSVGGYPSLLPWMIGAVLLECWARVLGSLDFLAGRRHHIWRMARSTKQVAERHDALLLVAFQCRAGSVRPAHLMRQVQQRTPVPAQLFWWDHRRDTVMFALQAEQAAGHSLQHQIDALAASLDTAHEAEYAVLCYRVVAFS